MDQTISTIIAAGVPTLAVIAAFVRNETALATLSARITSLELRLDARIETLDRDMRERISLVNARIETLDRDMRERISLVNGRIETLDRDLREWARISMRHNTDIARLKDKTGPPGRRELAYVGATAKMVVTSYMDRLFFVSRLSVLVSSAVVRGA